MPSNNYKHKCLHINVYIKNNKYIYIHTIVTAEVFQWCLSIKVMSTHFFTTNHWSFGRFKQPTTSHDFQQMASVYLPCWRQPLSLPNQSLANGQQGPPFKPTVPSTFRTSPYRIRQFFNNKPLKCFVSWLATTRLLKNWLLNTYEIIPFYHTG